MEGTRLYCACVSPLYDVIFFSKLCKYLLVREQSQRLQKAPPLGLGA